MTQTAPVKEQMQAYADKVMDEVPRSGRSGTTYARTRCSLPFAVEDGDKLELNLSGW